MTAAERLTGLLKALDRLAEDDRRFVQNEGDGKLPLADRRRCEETRDRSRDAFEATLRGLVKECERMQRENVTMLRDLAAVFPGSQWADRLAALSSPARGEPTE